MAPSRDEVSKLDGKEYRERIRLAVMFDDAGHQRCRAEEQLAPAASSIACKG